MSNYAKAVALVALAILAGCGGGTVPSASSPGLSSATRTSQSIVKTGNFTEYSLPSGANPSDLTRGPYDTLWFHSPFAPDANAKVYRFADSGGSVTTFTVSGFTSWSTGITSTGGFVYLIVAGPMQNEEYLARFTSSGSYTTTDTSNGDDPAFNLALGSDGRIWYPFCVEACGAFSGDYVGSLTLTAQRGPSQQFANFFPSFITPGPGSDLYATLVYDGPPPAPSVDSKVAVLNTNGTIVHQFNLPSGSAPAGITTGSDHNLWITEPGTNKIARMTPSGTFTQFTLPTANAKPDAITDGWDSALWFTETAANKIGRITTAGSITEYKIPTANSGSSGISTCSTTHCGTHGGVWFTETNANKIGQFNAPI